MAGKESIEENNIKGDDSDYLNKLNRFGMPIHYLVLGGLMGMATFGFMTMASNKIDNNRHHKAYASIKAEFTKTEFDVLKYEPKLDLIVGEAGPTLMYFNKTGSHVLIGNVLEVETGKDLSADRRSVLKNKLSMEARAKGVEAPSQVQPQARPEPKGADRPVEDIKVDVDLPIENMVVMNEGGKHVIHVVSDFNCSYCKRLYNDLPSLSFDMEIREIPTGVFGRQASSLKAAQVLCAEDREAAVKEAYDRSGGNEIVTCTDGERRVEENTAWARKIGVTGTPVVIMPDGTLIRGANMPRITQWLTANS